MAKPRIFVSSTYYDLKHLRSSLENFIGNLGFESILSEKGDVAYFPDKPLDHSCYREVNNADVFVLIIGGRYGSEISESKSIQSQSEFYNRYESITKHEYKNALESDIPIYILVEKAVYADYENFLKNKSNSTFNYAHVDSVNIFHFIEEILAQSRNNPVCQFDKYIDIQDWLKEQWAGLFRELLKRMSSQKQLTSLSAQVNNMAEQNQTLKNYLEKVIDRIAPNDSEEIIGKEAKRLNEAQVRTLLGYNPLIRHLQREKIPPSVLFPIFYSSSNVEQFLSKLAEEYPDFEEEYHRILANISSRLENDFLAAKNSLGLRVEKNEQASEK